VNAAFVEIHSVHMRLLLCLPCWFEWYKIHLIAYWLTYVHTFKLIVNFALRDDLNV